MFGIVLFCQYCSMSSLCPQVTVLSRRPFANDTFPIIFFSKTNLGFQLFLANQSSKHFLIFLSPSTIDPNLFAHLMTLMNTFNAFSDFSYFSYFTQKLLKVFLLRSVHTIQFWSNYHLKFFVYDEKFWRSHNPIFLSNYFVMYSRETRQFLF